MPDDMTAYQGVTPVQCVAILNQDSFYRELTSEEKERVHGDILFSSRCNLKLACV